MKSTLLDKAKQIPFISLLLTAAAAATQLTRLRGVATGPDSWATTRERLPPTLEGSTTSETPPGD